MNIWRKGYQDWLLGGSNEGIASTITNDRRINMEAARGQCVKVQTTADECVRVTIDIDTSLIPDDVNVLKWKNNMVLIQVSDVEIASPSE